MISTFFKLEGDKFQLETAENGAVAISKYEQFKPDVVILDIAMPVMDGVETLTRILKIDSKANVIMATASGSSEKIDECIRKGARGYVEKPFSPDELLATIRNLLKGGTKTDDIVTAFSLAGNKIQNSLHKIIDSSTSIVLKDIQVVSRKFENEIFYSNFAPTTQDAPRRDKMEEASKIEVPEECVGITAEISGQQDGIIVAVVNKTQIQNLSGNEPGYMTQEETDTYLEFFNIINNNLFSEIANFTHTKLDLSNPRLFDKEKDSQIKEKDFVKVTYEISREGEKIPLIFYLWFNVDSLISK